MRSEENLRRAQARFEELLDAEIAGVVNAVRGRSTALLSDSAAERQALTQRAVRLSDAMHAYRQALMEAAPHVGMEAGEDYRRAARDLPSQMTFFVTALCGYRRRQEEA